MGVVDQATDLKMIPSVVQSPCLKKWTCWLVAGLADDSFTRLFSDNFLHMFLFFIYKHRYKSKEIKKMKKMSTKNEQMSDLIPLVVKRQYLITYAQVNIEKFHWRATNVLLLNL